MSPHIETRPLLADDVDAAAGVLGDAFADYPWTKWVVDATDHVARITELQWITLHHLVVPHGVGWVTTVDGVVGSVAAWFDTAHPLPPHALPREAAARSMALEGDRHHASRAADAEVHGWRPTARHLYLATMGTRPTLQGKGLGARTLAPQLAVADELGLATCLETSSESNVRFYSRLGFRVVRQWTIAGGGPPVWTMRR